MAKDAGVSIGLFVDSEKVPDLVPLINDDGVIGYVRGDDLQAEKTDPSRDVVAIPVYAADGATLLGYELPDQGFVAGRAVLEGERTEPAPIPEGESPFG